MGKQEINNLIDKAVGTKGALNIPSFWMNKILKGIGKWISEELVRKQDRITDIDTIRKNAAMSKNAIISVKINDESIAPYNGNVDLGYINKPLYSISNSTIYLVPNIYYRHTSGGLSSLTIYLNSGSNSNIMNEYFVEFTTSSNGATVSFPSSVKWVDGITPT